MDSTSNTFSIFIKELKIGNDLYKFFDISKINEEKYCKLIIIIIVNIVYIYINILNYKI
jgi:hypothetical protein